MIFWAQKMLDYKNGSYVDFSNSSTYCLTWFNLWKTAFRMVENSLKIARDRDKLREPLVKLNQLFVTICRSQKMLNCKNGSYLDFSNFSTYYLTRFNLWKITFRMVEHS